MDFMAKSRKYLEEGDLLQASEKGWAAAAESVKAVARKRGWDHHGHRELFTVVGRLSKETKNRDIQSSFVTANMLHTNFYEGWLNEEQVAGCLDDVETFINSLSHY